QHGARWSGVQVLPRALNEGMSDLLLRDSSGSHYYAARETEADFLRVNVAQAAGAKLEHEKFLFYRGVGSFRAPLQVTLGASEDYVNLANSGQEPLTHLFVLDIHKTSGG